MMSTSLSSLPVYGDGGGVSNDDFASFTDEWFQNGQHNPFQSMASTPCPPPSGVTTESGMQPAISSSNWFVNPDDLGMFPTPSTSSPTGTRVEDETYVVPAPKGYKRRKPSQSSKKVAATTVTTAESPCPDTEPKEYQQQQQQQQEQPKPTDNTTSNTTSSKDRPTTVTAAAPAASPTRNVTEPVRRERNRTAAAKCRAKSKVAEEELKELQRIERDRNQMLRAVFEDLANETLALKHELLCHSACNHPVIDRYLLRSAEEISSGISSRQQQQQQQQHQRPRLDSSNGSTHE